MSHPVNRAFGTWVRTRRRHFGLTQEDLAREVGLSRPSIANIEVGRQNVLLSVFVDLHRVLSNPARAPRPSCPATLKRHLLKNPDQAIDFLREIGAIGGGRP